jgi:hypothetical protein
MHGLDQRHEGPGAGDDPAHDLSGAL